MVQTNSHQQNAAANGAANRPEVVSGIALRAVAEAVERLRYGVVQLTIHDGRVVQLDVTERQRFT
jgi:hypothetical protein